MTSRPEQRIVRATGETLELGVIAQGEGTLRYQWKKDGWPISGATKPIYRKGKLSAFDAGCYLLEIRESSGEVARVVSFVQMRLPKPHVVAWGENQAGQIDPPETAQGASVAVAAGSGYSLSVQADGTVLSWGADAYGLGQVPEGLREIVAVSAGLTHALALRADGTVAAWGNNHHGQCSVPADLADVVAVAASGSHSLALRADGTVVSWGLEQYSSADAPRPADLADIAAIGAGFSHSLAVRANGTVVAWGDNSANQCAVPAGLKGVRAVRGGLDLSLALTSANRVVAWGADATPPDGLARLPKNLGTIRSVSTALRYSIALRTDGSVVGWGYDFEKQLTKPAGLSRVAAVASGGTHLLALRDASADALPKITTQPLDHTVNSGGTVEFSVRAAGPFLRYQWMRAGQPVPGATTPVFRIGAAESGDAGLYSVIVRNGRGETASRAGRLTVLSTVPRFAAQPPARTVLLAGQPLSLTAALAPESAAAPGPIDYLWTHNGRPIPGATSPAYSVEAVGVGDSGRYVLEARDVAGRIARAVAFVLVRTPHPHLVEWTGELSQRDWLPDAIAFGDFVALSVGNDHTLALKADGGVVAWGSNTSGQCAVPADLGPVVAVAAGYGRSLALRADGGVTGWGYDNAGQASALAGLRNVVAIAAGASVSAALRADGTLVLWGYDGHGQLDVPADIQGRVAAVALGTTHVLALLRDGTVRQWGEENWSGWIFGDIPTNGEPPAGLDDVVAVSAQGYNSLALKADGTVVGWGGSWMSGPNIPAGLEDVSAIAAGYSFALAKRTDGDLVYWRYGYDWIVGPIFPGETPAEIAPPDAFFENASLVAAGSASATVLRDAGDEAPPTIATGPASLTVGIGDRAEFSVAAGNGGALVEYQWFKNDHPLAGETASVLRLLDVPLADSGAIYSVAVRNGGGTVRSDGATLTVRPALAISQAPVARSALHLGDSVRLEVAAVGEAPFTYRWKRNGVLLPGVDENALTVTASGPADAGYYVCEITDATGSVARAVSFVALRCLRPQVLAWGASFAEAAHAPSDLGDVVALGAGGGHALAIRADGTVRGWGANYAGQATPPADLGDVVQVAGGSGFSVVLRADGTVRQWGYNEFNRTLPPADLAGVVQIAAGSDHALALRANGTVVAWGRADRRQTRVPTTLANVVQIAAGDEYSLALRADGTVVAWGENYYVANNVPADLAGVVAIAAGDDHALALLADGSVRAWGDDRYGYVTLPAFGQAVSALSAGAFHSLALLADGTIRQWGGSSMSAPPATDHVRAISAGSGYGLLLREAINDPVQYAPIILRQPVGADATSSELITLSVEAQGWPDSLTYQWWRNGEKVIWSDGETPDYDIGGASYNTVGSYYVVVSNAAGSTRSETVRVREKPRLLWWVQQPLVFGEAARFDAGAYGDGGQVAGTLTYSIAPGAKLPAGEHLVTVSFAPTDLTRFAPVSIQEKLVVQAADPGLRWMRPTKLRVGTPLGSAQLNATADVAGTFAYEPAAGTMLKAGTHPLKVHFTPANPNYQTIDATVNIVVSAVEQAPPAKVLAGRGESILLEVRALGEGLSYRWKKDGVLIPGATAASLEIASVGPAQIGAYTVEVRDSQGGVSYATTFVRVQLEYPEIVTWGYGYADSERVVNFTELHSPVSVGIGGYYDTAINADGGVVFWQREMKPRVPTLRRDLGDVVAVDLTPWPARALRSDGTVVTFFPNDATAPVEILSKYSEVVALGDALLFHADGHASPIDTWGAPERIEDIAAAAMNLAVGVSGEIRIQPSSIITVLPDDIGPVSALSGRGVFLARKTDGTLVSWRGYDGAPLPIPASAHGDVAIAAGWSYAIALPASGTPVIWQMSQTPFEDTFRTGVIPPGTTNVIAVALDGHGLALREAAGDTLPVPPLIEQQPLPRQLLPGERAEFSVVAVNGNRSYQWFKDGELIDGATSASYAINTVLPEDTGYYHVVVKNFAGSTKSVEVSLTVLPEPATIATPPTPRTVVQVGGLLDLSVTPKGTPPFSYQWKHQGRPIAEASGPSLRRSGLTYGQGGAYSVTVTDGTGGSSTALAFVRVALQAPHLFGVDPSSEKVFSLRDRSDVVAARCGEAAMFVLRRDGTVARLHPDGTTETVAGVTDAVDLAVGVRHALILRANGTVLMHKFDMEIDPLDQPGRPPADLTGVVAVSAGANVSLALRADGSVVGWGYDYENGAATPPAMLPGLVFLSTDGSTSYGIDTGGAIHTWGASNPPAVPVDASFFFRENYSGLVVKSDGTFVGWGGLAQGFAASPRIIDVAKHGLGYLLLRENGAITTITDELPQALIHCATKCVDLDGRDAFIALREGASDTPPAITRQPVPKAVPTGAEVTLGATVSSRGPISYQWLKNNQIVEGATAPTLAIAAATAEDAGDYVLLVRSATGEARSVAARLTVIPPPEIVIDAAAYQTLAPGQTLTVTAGASGQAPFKYRWRKNLAAISGATGARYAVKAGKPGTADWYSVTVTDKYGMKATAQLFVATPPTRTSELTAWGVNYHDELAVPYDLAAPRGIAVGPGISASLGWDGSLTTWGDGIYGYGSPPAGLSGVASVAIGKTFASALRGDGTVAAWGSVAGPWLEAMNQVRGVIAIAAGEEHLLALRPDGTVVGAGSNFLGATEVPAGLKGVVAIACGANHSLALKSNGAVVTWGGDSYANLQVPRGLSGVKAIAAGSTHSLALRTNGTVVAWGLNIAGETTVPAGLKNVVAIAAAGERSYALKSDGTVVSWGIASSVAEVPTEMNSRISAFAVAETHGLLLREPAPAMPAASAATTKFASRVELAAKSAADDAAPAPEDDWLFTRIGDRLVGFGSESEATVEWSIDLALAGSPGFTVWQAWYFDDVELADEAISGPEAILGPDSSPNLAKYVAGIGPREAVEHNWMRLDPITGQIEAVDEAFLTIKVAARGPSWRVSFELP